MADEFGDFQEVKEEEPANSQVEQEQEGGFRIKLPRKGEFIGKVIQRLGGNRMEVKCTDGKTRNSRVPGRFKRRFWLRPGDFVIVKPWEFDDDKADVIFQYRKGPAVSQLKKRGLLDNLKDEF